MNRKEIKILILSNNCRIQKALNHLFSNKLKNLKLTCHTNEQLNEIQIEKHDLIIIDNVDSIEFLELIQSIKSRMSADKQLLVILDSPLYSQLDLFIEAGISDFIVKPYSDDVLKLRIENHFNFIDASKMSRNKELQFDALLNNTPYMAWFKDKDSHYITVNREFREHSGKSDEMIHGRDDHFVWDGKIGDRCREFDLTVMNEQRQIVFDEVIPGKKGYRQFNIYKAPVSDETGDVIGTIGIARDITELKNQDAKMSIIIENIPFSIFLTDIDGNFVDANENYLKFIEKKREEIIGYLSYSIVEDPEVRQQDELVLQSKKTQRFIRTIDIKGDTRTLEIYKAPVFGISNEMIGIVGMIRDVTESIRTQEHIKKLAYTDFLTSLENRRSLYHYIGKNLKDKNIPLTLMFIDLDNFKKLNDSFGHHYGDEALITISNKLLHLCQDAFVARIGGDEFVVVWENLDENTLLEILNQILTEMKTEFSKGEKANIISVSIGVVKNESSNVHVDTLLLKGDLALYKAKEKGKNQYVIYTDDLEKERQFALQMEQDLRRAITNKQIEVVYQPQYTVDKKLLGFEALFRWRHPRYKEIPVLDVIQLVEELHIIEEVTEFISIKACNFAKQINKNRKDKLIVSINISALQIMNDNFVEQFKTVLEHVDVHPSNIGIEITETILMQNLDENMEKIRELKELGVTISLDDFGTGYSSLNYLVNLPLSKLKIDRSFIHGMKRKDEFKNLVRLIKGIAHSLGLPVIAEGVETKEELDLLKEMDIDCIQGYYFSKPLSEEAAKNLIK